MTRENPFDVLEVDPQSSSRDLTRRLKKLAERATGDERTRLQALWEQVTLHEADRIRWALLAHPRPDAADGRGIDLLRQAIGPATSRLNANAPELTIDDVICWPDESPSSEKQPVVELRPPFPWT